MKRTKQLFQYRDYEVLLRPAPKKAFLPVPRLELRKVPPKPVKLAGAAGSVEGDMTKESLGFPFTTRNAGSLQIGFPRISGGLRLSAEDPPTGADSDEAQRALEAAYDQVIPGIGEVEVKAKTTGEWGASFARQVEDIGRLRGAVNSQLDWSVDLDSTYPAVKGFVPSVTYGATQDGMRVRAKVDGFFDKGLSGSYAVENEPGKYSAQDLLHDGTLTLSSTSGRHVLEAKANYDRKLPKAPVRGSFTYTTRVKPVTLEASVDYDRYRLRARTGQAQVAAALGRRAEEAGKPRELELKLGKLSATAVLGGEKPRVRMALAL